MWAASGVGSRVGSLCSRTGFLQKGILNPFRANPLNKFTITKQKGKYDTNLRGGGEEMRGKLKP